MKKTVSMLLAILVAAITLCTFVTSAFAVEITDPVDDRLEPTTVTTTKATTTAAPTTAAPTTTKAAETTAAPTEAASTTKFTLPDIVVTRPEGATVIDEGTTAAPATTKKPAANVSTIPSTGSSAVAPVIALLALAAGTVAVVKTKKDN